MALEEDLPEKPEDKTLPKYRQIDKRAGAYAIDWGHELHKQYEAWRAENENAVALPAKRAAPTDGEEVAVRGKKKAKSAETEEALDDAHMKHSFEKGTLGKVSHN